MRRLAAAVVMIAACSPFEPGLPGQPFLCGSAAPICPDGFVCVTQGARRVCTDSELPTIDAAVTSAVDAAVARDAAIDAAPVNTCAHDLCTVGAKLESTCTACVTQICATDSYCCDTKWSAQCVGEVSSVCADEECN